MSQQFQGKVKFYSESKGFGFISEHSTKKEYFMHVSGIKEDTLNTDDEVTFELAEGRKPGLIAVNVQLA